jgi:putative tryptophan/tyrosine transport system substrate-binding protein
MNAALAQVQPATKVHRIGFLMGNFPAALTDRLEAFRQGLRELGYVEGKNVVVEYRSAEEKTERLPALAAELVRLRVDVIVTAGPTVTRAAKEATSTIPIVMAFDSDPVGSGFVASLARPGGNVTGLSALYPEISGKQLELLKEITPRLSRVTAVGTLSQPGTAQVLKALELAAGESKVELRYVDVIDGKQIETAFREARKARADAVIALASAVFVANRRAFADLAVKARLPVMYSVSEHVEHGGLASYGVNRADLYRRAAAYVDKILKGARPADLPVEQPTRFELIVNRKAARQIGLPIPESVLQRADRLID